MVGFLMVLIYRSGLLQALFNDSAHQCGCNLSYSIWISFSLLGQLGYTEINLFRQVWVRERDCTRSETGGPFRRVRAVWGGHYCITCWTTQRCTSNRKLSKLSKNLLVLYRDIDTVTPLWVHFFFQLPLSPHLFCGGQERDLNLFDHHRQSSTPASLGQIKTHSSPL